MEHFGIRYRSNIGQRHTYVLERHPVLGFGIKVAGGVDNPNVRTGDTSAIVSDLLKDGPAWDKLKVCFILCSF